MDFNDPRWVGLNGGYRVPYDPRPALRAIDQGDAGAVVWQELWDNLHHQGDVGEASYASLPHIARRLLATRSTDWNGYALAATIESVRHRPDNPPIPDWLASDYQQAWKQLIELALALLKDADDRELVLSLISVVAAGKGFPLLATVATFPEDELREILGRNA